MVLGRAALLVPEAGVWAGGTLLWAPSTSLPGHRPCQAAAEKACKTPRELGRASSFPAEWRLGKMVIETEIGNNLEYSGNQIKTSSFHIDSLKHLFIFALF